MKDTFLDDAVEALTPSENQKAKMWKVIQSHARHESLLKTKTRKPRFFGRKLLTPLAAVVLVLIISVSALTATVGSFASALKEGVRQLLFANESSVTHHTDSEGNTSVGTDGKEGGWIVRESKGKLILSIHGKKIDISQSLSEQGYYYYTYRDSNNLLHRVYIVKNAGGAKDYAEREYSQFEWLPEKNTGGGSRVISGPLAEAIMTAEAEFADGDGSLDELLRLSLKKYWERYGDEE